jgi:hypothetical protein
LGNVYGEGFTKKKMKKKNEKKKRKNEYVLSGVVLAFRR